MTENETRLLLSQAHTPPYTITLKYLAHRAPMEIILSRKVQDIDGGGEIEVYLSRVFHHQAATVKELEHLLWSAYRAALLHEAAEQFRFNGGRPRAAGLHALPRTGLTQTRPLASQAKRRQEETLARLRERPPQSYEIAIPDDVAICPHWGGVCADPQACRRCTKQRQK